MNEPHAAMPVTLVNDLRACRNQLLILLAWLPRLAGRADTTKLARCGKPLLDEIERVLVEDGLAAVLGADYRRVTLYLEEPAIGSQRATTK